MAPTLRELIEAPESMQTLSPEARAAVLGQVVILLAQLLVQAAATPVTTPVQKGQDPARLLTVAETAHLLSVRPPHVYELIRRRRLPALRVGKYVRVRSRDLQAWIEDQRGEGVDGRIQPGLSSPQPMTRPSTKVRGKRSR
jgi:excisionase family DNA binding protein